MSIANLIAAFTWFRHTTRDIPFPEAEKSFFGNWPTISIPQAELSAICDVLNCLCIAHHYQYIRIVWAHGELRVTTDRKRIESIDSEINNYIAHGAGI